MTTKPVIPSQDPSDSDSVDGTFRTILRKNGERLEGQLPAIVMSYDRTRNVARVRPLIQILLTNGSLVSRASIASVPCLALGGGGYVLTFPVKAGDLGWIEASDRDISLFTQSLKESPPNTLVIHKFAYGRFIPDAFRNYAINAEDANAATLQSADGSVCIALDAGQLRMRAPIVDIQASTLFRVTAPAIQMAQTGGGPGTTFSGSPVVMPDAIINGVTQSTHIHTEHDGFLTGGPHN
jgi:hypothetical protein